MITNHVSFIICVCLRIYMHTVACTRACVHESVCVCILITMV